MNGLGVLERIGELARSGETFALATVVWRQGPSSSKQGSRAIITSDGQLHGWIGGACAEPVVIREAKQVMTDGNPRLLLLGSPDQFGTAVPEGMTVVPISCQSEGALEVYIEPVLPVPHLVIVGSSPMAHTLAELARALGWSTDLLSTQDFAVRHADERSMVVVATQGHGDEDMIERAVAMRPAYLGLVASRKRAEAVLGYLAERGVPQGPAGPGARARRPGPRQDEPRGDGRRDPRGAGAAARVGRPCGHSRSPHGTGPRAEERAEARRGRGPGLRDDGHGGRSGDAA